MKKSIAKCPHCGSDWGIYTKSDYLGVQYNTGFNGERQDNGEMYDNAKVRGGYNAYCQKCDKLICRLSTIEKQWAK